MTIRALVKELRGLMRNPPNISAAYLIPALIAALEQQKEIVPYTPDGPAEGEGALREATLEEVARMLEARLEPDGMNGWEVATLEEAIDAVRGLHRTTKEE